VVCDRGQCRSKSSSCLRHAVGHSALLRLSTRMGDGVLVLRGPGDKVVEKQRLAQSGLAYVWTTRLVSSSIDDELEGVARDCDKSL
jgi:hypothetical protein